MTESANGNRRSMEQWFQHFDTKLDRMDDNIQAQLNGKVDKDDHDRTQDRLLVVEGKSGVASHVKNAGGATLIASVVVAVKAALGG